jgi:hypothetical protein
LREVNVFETISRLQFRAGGNIHSHIAEFTSLLSEVRNLKGLKSIPDTIWIGRFLRSLPEEFSTFTHSYDRQLDTVELYDVLGSAGSKVNNKS